jgi:hypothetical protein
MRIRRNTLWAVFAAVLILAAIAAAILLRKRAAPEVARLLPDADAVLYVNLEPIRLLTNLGRTPPKNREPEYEDFVRQTGFEFERDLDRAAIAIHNGIATNGKGGETRFSEVLQGRFDSTRVSQYLRKLAKDVEHYRDYDIFIIPLEGRTVRVTLLTFDLAAASNTDGPDVIHGIIDRQKQAALPFPGPPLVSEYYRRVPLGSVIWTIAINPTSSAPANRGELLLPGTWAGLLPRGSVVVASARPLNGVHLRAQVLTRSDDEARRFTDRVDTFLVLLKSLDISMDSAGPDPDVKAAFQSIEVRQEKNEASLTATVPFAFFKKLLSEPPVEFGSGTQNPPVEEAQPAAKSKLKSKH